MYMKDAGSTLIPHDPIILIMMNILYNNELLFNIYDYYNHYKIILLNINFKDSLKELYFFNNLFYTEKRDGMDGRQTLNNYK